MQQALFLIGFCFTCLSFGQNITFADANFKQALLSQNGIDTNFDSEISQEEALNVRVLDLDNQSIFDLSGIEFFSNLEHLYIAQNHLSALDISALNQLAFLDCAYNQINSLNLSDLQSLVYVDVSFNQISTLPIENQTQLVYLDVSNNLLSNLGILNLEKLNFLSFTNNQISNIGMPSSNNIQFISFAENAIDHSNWINNLQKLWSLDVSFTNLTNLDLNNLDSLRWIHASQTSIPTFDFGNNSQLAFADLSKNNSLQDTLEFCHQNPDLLQFVLIDQTSVKDAFLPNIEVLNEEEFLFEKEANASWVDCSALLSTKNPQNKTIDFYPNPASNFVEFLQTSIKSIEIYAMDGKIVLAKENPAKRINLQQLPNGVYIVKAITQDNQRISKKLIIKKEK